ncbi:MAG: DMT family transporter [Anaerolineae bacterium]|nr:DMT family transporter [Anaerolineae bacterium]
MQNLVWVVVIGLLGGVAVGLQDPLSSLMSERIGPLESTFIIHLGGAVLSFLPLLAVRGGNLSQWRSVPWYALVSGALGILLFATLSYTIPRIGVTSAVTLLIAGQLAASVALDHFGLLGLDLRALDPGRLLGIVIVCLGAWLVVR